jgi:hypothetical protein
MMVGFNRDASLPRLTLLDQPLQGCAMPTAAGLEPGVIFPWDSTPRGVHLTSKTRQIVPYFLNLGQFVLNMGSQLNG